MRRSRSGVRGRASRVYSPRHSAGIRSASPDPSTLSYAPRRRRTRPASPRSVRSSRSSGRTANFSAFSSTGPRSPPPPATRYGVRPGSSFRSSGGFIAPGPGRPLDASSPYRATGRRAPHAPRPRDLLPLPVRDGARPSEPFADGHRGPGDGPDAGRRGAAPPLSDVLAPPRARDRDRGPARPRRPRHARLRGRRRGRPSDAVPARAGPPRPALPERGPNARRPGARDRGPPRPDRPARRRLPRPGGVQGDPPVRRVPRGPRTHLRYRSIDRRVPPGRGQLRTQGPVRDRAVRRREGGWAPRRVGADPVRRRGDRMAEGRPVPDPVRRGPCPRAGGAELR